MEKCALTAAIIIGLFIVIIICIGGFKVLTENYSDRCRELTFTKEMIMGKDYIIFDWYRWTDSDLVINIGEFKIDYRIDDVPYSDFNNLETKTEVVEVKYGGNKNICWDSECNPKKYYKYHYVYKFKYYPRRNEEQHSVVIKSVDLDYYNGPYFVNYKFKMPDIPNISLTRPYCKDMEGYYVEAPDLFKTFGEFLNNFFNLVETETNPMMYRSISEYIYPYVHGFLRPMKPLMLNFLKIDVSGLEDNYMYNYMKVVVKIFSRDQMLVYSDEFIPSIYPMNKENNLTIYTGPRPNIWNSLTTNMNKGGEIPNSGTTNKLILPFPTYDFPPNGSPYIINVYYEPTYPNMILPNETKKIFKVLPLQFGKPGCN